MAIADRITTKNGLNLLSVKVWVPDGHKITEILAEDVSRVLVKCEIMGVEYVLKDKERMA